MIFKELEPNFTDAQYAQSNEWASKFADSLGITQYFIWFFFLTEIFELSSEEH